MKRARVPASLQVGSRFLCVKEFPAWVWRWLHLPTSPSNRKLFKNRGWTLTKSVKLLDIETHLTIPRAGWHLSRNGFSCLYSQEAQTGVESLRLQPTSMLTFSDKTILQKDTISLIAKFRQSKPLPTTFRSISLNVDDFAIIAYFIRNEGPSSVAWVQRKSDGGRPSIKPLIVLTPRVGGRGVQGAGCLQSYLCIIIF